MHIPSNNSKEIATKSSVVSYNIRNGIHPNVYQIKCHPNCNAKKKQVQEKDFCWMECPS